MARDSTDEIPCKACGRAFKPSAKQRKLLAEARSDGNDFVALDCPFCPNLVEWNPISNQPAPAGDEEPLPRCPTVRCTGYVAEIQEANAHFWACGECGVTWKSEAQVNAAIDAAVRRFPHRAGAYRRKGKRWLPAEIEPEDYEDRVESEPFDTGE